MAHQGSCIAVVVMAVVMGGTSRAAATESSAAVASLQSLASARTSEFFQFLDIETLVAVRLSELSVEGEDRTHPSFRAEPRPPEHPRRHEASVSAQSSAAPAPGSPESRVRTHSPIIRALIHDASERSKTFRGLVAAIDASDGLVYLNVGTCGRVRACFLHRVTLAGPSRVLHIVVDVRRQDLDLAAAIGHELQHALEVLGDTRIRTDLDIVAFYARHGLKLTGLNGAIETDAAIAAGDAVRDELQRASPTDANALQR